MSALYLPSLWGGGGPGRAVRGGGKSLQGVCTFSWETPAIAIVPQTQPALTADNVWAPPCLRAGPVRGVRGLGRAGRVGGSSHRFSRQSRSSLQYNYYSGNLPAETSWAFASSSDALTSLQAGNSNPQNITWKKLNFQKVSTNWKTQF